MTAQREDAAIGTVVLTTGGTISSRPDSKGGVVAGVSGEDLVAAVPGLDELGDLVVREVMNVGSYVITPEQMFIIAAAAWEAAAEPGVAGVVVTHWTDTMEETAYLTDLLHTGPQPIVFTGAQRHAEAHDADGPRNVLDAVRISRSPAARGIGAVIAMAGRIDGPARRRSCTPLRSRPLAASSTVAWARCATAMSTRSSPATSAVRRRAFS